MKDELISRQAAIKAIYELQGRASTKAELTGISKAWKKIKALPPVQPKHGEWEYHSNPTIGINPETAYCSCCGFRVDTTGNIDFDEYNFCPRCGVRMEM